jgi:radical SAM superfamily enzyme YgiQ (UPF0313 family)
MPRLLLINPKFPESFWSFKWALAEVLPDKRAVCPPLGLATLAALCPPHWQVQIVDENIEPIPLHPDADIVGVCGMGVQLARQRELLAYYAGLGHYVVAGGSFASLCPEEYATPANTVVSGEAEYIWPKFCADFDRGAPAALYRETGTVALTDSPVPRFDLLKLARYSNATLQYSRGCPFRCEFCDIIVMFGRKPRVKSVEQVGRELDALREAGVRSVFFVDDNLIGNLPQAKALLRFLAKYQEEHRYAFSFGTEASLNMAQDKPLLELFRAANFGWVFIGIESPDPASLKETLKTQNLREDMLTSVQRIYSYGIDVLGGFIIGFDNDTLETFDHQYRFITESGIQSAMIGLLTAMPRTPLYERLQKEGRLIPSREQSDNTRARTNVVPKNMSADALAAGYEDLYRRLLTDEAIAQRIRNKARHLRTPLYSSGYSVRERAGILLRLVVRGILPGGVSRTWQFLRTLPVCGRSGISLVVSDWIIGLSMRAFARQHLDGAAPVSAALEQRVASVRTALSGYLARGQATLDLRAAPDAHVAIALKSPLDRRFFIRAGSRLERLLRHTRATLTLRIDPLQPPQRDHFQRLLDRLARYGDRVWIVADDESRRVVAVDSSVFNLVLEPQPGSKATAA